MSELQIWLLAIGAIVVIAVLLYNWTQERRFRRQADAAFQAPVADVLMAPGVRRDAPQRVEPALHGEPDFESEPAVDRGEAIEPRLVVEPVEATAWHATDEAASGAATPRSVGAAEAAAPPYDELIEYRVRIEGTEMASAGFAETYAQTRTLGKPVRWFGLPAGAVEWEEIQPWRDGRYDRVMVTLQLADRNGAVHAEQLGALCELLQAMAQSMGLRIACDDLGDALGRALAIDRFCVDVDVLIGLNVVARGDGVLNLVQIMDEAEDSGMVLGADGTLQLLDSRGEPLYALCNHDGEPLAADLPEDHATPGITLQFDVPRVPDGVKVFDGMVAFGRRLANDVGGILVDDNLRPLTDAGIEKIRTQLQQLYQRMDARGVPSGSRRSLRLFS
ncbi:MAG TPA: cell division protein ZipA C-terminal FtsZ-binding domain-containing protein [Thiobacillaceae bacterium]|nr:cell division protein ZipA C-terminal FtsZ-binding domain-containing protein [Thiobacillaceae bacterium]